MMTLYHCGHTDFTDITDLSTGFFEGLFCSTQPLTCFGPIVNEFEIEKSEIATTFILNFHFDYEELMNAMKNIPSSLYDDYKIEDVMNAAIDDDATLFEDCDGEERGEKGWELQRVRGQIAKNLGFKAVEMRDETGTSYLLVKI